MTTATRTLQERPTVAVICGRRRERFPDASIYNRLIDIEWDTPVGEAKYCGGDALIRVKAFLAVGGYDPTLIAGEEPEYCVRLRHAGWKILRIDAEMTLHDATMARFAHWWKRSVRQRSRLRRGGCAAWCATGTALGPRDDEQLGLWSDRAIDRTGTGLADLGSQPVSGADLPSPGLAHRARPVATGPVRRGCPPLRLVLRAEQVPPGDWPVQVLVEPASRSTDAVDRVQGGRHRPGDRGRRGGLDPDNSVGLERIAAVNVLVTGATGFLGRHLVDALLRRGHTVCALVRPAHRDRHGFDPRVRIHVADLVEVEEADLSPAFDAIGAVAHLAAVFVGSIEKQRRATVESTRRFLEAMARSRARRLVLAGSLSVYDWGQARDVLDEQTPLETRPHERDAYAIAKIEQEELVRQYSVTHGFDLTVLRPGFIWAAQPGSATIALGQDFGPLRVVIGPERRLPLVHVENCAEAFALAIEDERAVGETFNVVDPEVVTARWFAQAIGA